MRPQILPDKANLEQLKKRARSLQRLVRDGDAAAVDVAKQFHPRLRSAVPGSPEFAAFTLSDAQLVIARQFGSPSWPKLKARVARAGTATEIAQTGVAMRTVAAAFTAVSEGRFDDLAAIVSPAIDWRGLPDEDGEVPRCSGRDQALERMRIGLLANRQVSVSAFVEDGDRVLAHVHRTDDDGDDDAPAERFVIAEVHDGQITQMRGYAVESQALDALHGTVLPDAVPASTDVPPVA